MQRIQSALHRHVPCNMPTRSYQLSPCCGPAEQQTHLAGGGKRQGAVCCCHAAIVFGVALERRWPVAPWRGRRLSGQRRSQLAPRACAVRHRACPGGREHQLRRPNWRPPCTLQCARRQRGPPTGWLRGRPPCRQPRPPMSRAKRHGPRLRHTNPNSSDEGGD